MSAGFHPDNESTYLTLSDVTELAKNPGNAVNLLPELLRTLESDDEELRSWVTDVLQDVTNIPIGIGESLIELCMHPQAPIASWACKLLSRMAGQPATGQAAIANALMRHSEVGVRQQAAIALASFSDLDDVSLSALEDAASGNDPRLKRLAAQALDRHKAA